MKICSEMRENPQSRCGFSRVGYYKLMSNGLCFDCWLFSNKRKLQPVC